ncbi:DUF4244 domain-containing protein [Nonomuraea glycinis]|uniref:DUF4244 domain-containing protein n=1 Tax=Nonomuraea glycinis TaxID=2047744 RepID=UPI002E0E3B24
MPDCAISPNNELTGNNEFSPKEAVSPEKVLTRKEAASRNKTASLDETSAAADNSRSSQARSLKALSQRLSAHCRHWWSDRRARFTGAHGDRGMSTAEYAVGTIAACAFAALLFKIVNSPEVTEMLSALIDRALKLNG